jgi:hypothetical protein
LTASTNIFTANAITAASFNQAAADKVWLTAARTVTGADNITSNNNKLILHTDDKVLLAGTTHTSAVVPTVTTTGNVTTLSANAIAASSFNTDAAPAVATAVWAKTDAVLSQTYAVLVERLYRFFMNKMIITDASGAVALKDEAETGTLASQTITDDDTSTTRTALTWS